MTMRVRDMVEGRTMGFGVYIYERKAQRVFRLLLFGPNYTALSDRTSQPCLTLIVEASMP